MTKIYCPILGLFILSFAAYGDSSDNTLRFYLDNTDLELDHHKAMNNTEAQLFSALYEGLVSYHPSVLWGDPVPMFMKQFWEEKLETTVRIETILSELYYDSLREPGYTLGHLSWAEDYADPMIFLQMWESISSFNDALYNRKEYDKLLRESAQSSTEERFSKLSNDALFPEPSNSTL